MPIEIKELHIKATLDNGDGNSSSGSNGDSGAAPTDALIQTCVDKVLEILKDKNDR